VWCWWHGGRGGLGFFARRRAHYSTLPACVQVVTIYIFRSFCVLLSVLFIYLHFPRRLDPQRRDRVWIGVPWPIRRISGLLFMSEQPAGETWRTWDYEGVPAVYRMISSIWRAIDGTFEWRERPTHHTRDTWDRNIWPEVGPPYISEQPWWDFWKFGLLCQDAKSKKNSPFCPDYIRHTPFSPKFVRIVHQGSKFATIVRINVSGFQKSLRAVRNCF
jgi:hypothetical protein